MDLFFVIAMQFLLKDDPSLKDFFYVLTGTPSDDPVLEPTIRPLDFPLGLGRQRMPDLHPALLNHSLPLGKYLICPLRLFLPNAFQGLRSLFLFGGDFLTRMSWFI